MKKYIYIILLFISCNVCRYETVYAQVTVTNYENATLATSATNGSMPTDYEAGKLYITLIATSASTTPPEPTFSGTGQTWTSIGSVTQGNTRITALRFYSTSVVTSSTVISFNTTITGYGYSRYAISGMPTTGTNGADAIVQFATNSGTSANPSITLASLSPNAAVIAGFFNNTNPFNGTAESGWTEDYDAGNTNPNGTYSMHRLTTTDNTPTVTAAASDWAGIAIEIKPLATRRVMIINQP